jgi:hypothetical protein
VSKLIPLVLVVSISLIFGTQAAYAQIDVWGFYCEEGDADLADMGALVDAFGGAPGSSDSDTCALKGNVAGNIIRLPWGDAPSPIVYKSISEKNNLDDDPNILVECYAGAPDPDQFNQFEWDFSSLNSPAGGQASRWDCIDNFRADEDLGIGIDDPSLSNQPLEVQNGELVALNIKALRDAGYGNFKFIISSNSPASNNNPAEVGWLGTSPLGPLDGDMTRDHTDVTVVGVYPGCNPGIGCANNDAYISINGLEDWLYYKQVGQGRDNLIQQIMAEKSTPPGDMVGGQGGQIDRTSLLVTGAQVNASWMIPLLISAIGIGVFVVTRKS